MSRLESQFYKYFFALMTLLLAMISSRSMGDLAIWISEGQQIFLQKTIYITDIFSLNPTTSYPYPWLSAVIYFLINQFVGINGIFWIHRLIPCAITLFWLNRYPQLLYKKNWWIIVVSIIGSSTLYIDRPALLVLPLVVLAFYFFEKNFLRKKSYVLFILLFLWVQLHGSFILYFLFLGWKFIVNVLVRKKTLLFYKYVRFAGISFLISLMNPWGIKIYEYVFVTAKVSAVRMTEWEPLKLSGSNQIISIFAIVFVLSIFALLLLKKIKSKALTKSSSVLFFMMIVGVRNISLFFVTWPLAYFERNKKVIFIDEKISIIKKSFNVIILLLLFLISLFMSSEKSNAFRKQTGKASFQYYDETVVSNIFNYLQNESENKFIFNDWAVGSHLSLLSDVKIFIDTRNIIYSDQTVLDYKNIYSHSIDYSQEKIQSMNINYILINASSLLAQSLQSSPNWSLVMTEGLYVLYKKN